MRKTTITKITLATRRRVIVRETGDPPAAEKTAGPLPVASNPRDSMKLQPQNEEKAND